MKKYWLICLLPFTFIACKKEKTITPEDPQAAIIGTWKETAIYNYTYDRGALTEIDTIPAMTDGTAMYTEFYPGGTYESYTLNGTTHTNTVFDKYTYHTDLGVLMQNWPAKNPNGIRNNVNHYKTGAPLFENGPNNNMYTIVTLNNKQLTFTEKLAVFDFAGSDTPQGYIMQTRTLIRQ